MSREIACPFYCVTIRLQVDAMPLERYEIMKTLCHGKAGLRTGAFSLYKIEKSNSEKQHISDEFTARSVIRALRERCGLDRIDLDPLLGMLRTVRPTQDYFKYQLNLKCNNK